ncbi:MAG: hypothetical protein WD844_12625 [Thermoleophilaceae bacterium]
MPSSRQLTIAFALARIAYGVALIAAPRRAAAAWIGGDADRRPTQLAVRGLGARDIALSAGTLAARSDGEALRPWLIACAACDLADIAATLAARKSLPDRAAPGTVALAGAAAATGIGLAATTET